MTFASLIQTFVTIINQLTLVAGACAVAFFMYGVVNFIRASGDTGKQKAGYSTIVWGLTALVVLFAMGGLINLLASSFFGVSARGGGSTSNLNSATAPVLFTADSNPPSSFWGGSAAVDTSCQCPGDSNQFNCCGHLIDITPAQTAPLLPYTSSDIVTESVP